MSKVADRYRGSPSYHLVMKELIGAAQYRGTTTVRYVAGILGLPLPRARGAAEAGYVLDEIAEDEVRAGRPMLSSVAVDADGKPGSGYFAFARELGRLPAGEDDTSFWQRELAAVYEAWKRPTFPRRPHRPGDPRPYREAAAAAIRSVVEGGPETAPPGLDVERLRRMQLEGRQVVMRLPLEDLARGDPRSLIREVHARISEKRDRLGDAGLRPTERDAYAALSFEMEVDNGGIHQYFLNGAGDDAQAALSFLTRIDAPPWAGILAAAMARFEGGAPPAERRARLLLLEKLGVSAFRDLDGRFFASSSISGVVALWLRDHLAELDLPPFR